VSLADMCARSEAPLRCTDAAELWTICCRQAALV
jgi:hypothetical protein